MPVCAYVCARCMLGGMSEDDELVARLRARAEYHEQQTVELKAAMDEHAAESRKFRGALAALGATESTPSDEAASATKQRPTPELISDVLTDQPMSTAEVTTALLTSGWQTASANPLNTIRTALGRMAEKNLAAQTRDGRWVRYEGTLESLGKLLRSYTQPTLIEDQTDA